MNLKEAIEFIAFENKITTPQLWLDLGCGSGLFTMALTNYLPANSKIIAVDKDEKALKQIPASANHIQIEKIVADFIHDTLEVKGVDGIFMANSLHYVKNKEVFLDKIAALMKTNSAFLVVEYDRTTANHWVPYPLTVDTAKNLFKKLGYPGFYLLNKKPSVYGNHNMYAAIIRN